MSILNKVVHGIDKREKCDEGAMPLGYRRNWRELQNPVRTCIQLSHKQH